MEITGRNVMLCKMSGELFALSCKKGYDSEDFINKVMQSEEGNLLYSPNCIDMWLGADYVMQGLENDIYIEKGKVINNDIMRWIGYLYKYWSLTYPNESAKEILKQAPFDTLVQCYLGYHVMSCEDAILNLKELYLENN